MYKFNLRLADKVISASVQYKSTIFYCKDYLTDDPAEISVSVTDKELLYEKEKSMIEHEAEWRSDYEPSFPYLETLALYRRIAEALVEYGIILFHGSAISLDGEVYLFTARSGTGKSTHTRLWREVFGKRAVMVNDDKPLIKVDDSGVTVYGTPWCGKHRLGENISAPLKAICILERAEENSIHREDGVANFPKILSQTYRFADVYGMKKTMSLIDKMLKHVKVYRLGCNMERDAAIVAYNGMK